MSNLKTYVFVDTNILFHYKPLIQIKWSEILGQDCKLVIAPIVIDEIDKHRRSSKRKLADKAKTIAKHFEKVIDGEEVDDLLLFLHQRPSGETFKKYGLDSNEQDDCLLTTILEFSKAHPSENIFLVTDDIGPRLKAKSLNINVAKIPDEYQLPDEVDEKDTLIEKLKRENSDLKNRIPKVDLFFKGKKKQITSVFTSSLVSQDDFLQKKMDVIKTQYPFLKDEMAQKDISSITVPEFLSLSQQQINDYNNNLSNFYKTYEEYVSKLFSAGKNKLLSLKIELEIYNEGTVPAEDIDLWLHFPDGFELFDNQDFCAVSPEPKPPYKPKNRFDFGNLTAIPQIINPYSQSISPAIFDRPSIKKTNSYEVEMHCSSLKHNHSFQFDDLFIKYSSFEDVKGFEILYKLTVANIPKIINGSINVITLVEE